MLLWLLLTRPHHAESVVPGVGCLDSSEGADFSRAALVRPRRSLGEIERISLKATANALLPIWSLLTILQP